MINLRNLYVAVMFMLKTQISSVINSIYSGQKTLPYILYAQNCKYLEKALMNWRAEVLEPYFIKKITIYIFWTIS
jgi:hypothetical protein